MAQSVLMQLLLEIRQFRQAWDQAAVAAQTGAQKISRQAQAGGRAMDQASQKARGFAGVMDFLKKRVIGAGLFFAAFYQGLITFRQLIGNAVAELFNLDDALRRVQSITKESDASIARLRDNLLDLAKKGQLFDQSAAAVADSMFEISQAGFVSSDALTLARLAAEGAAVGFTTADVAARVLVGVLKAFDLPVSKARDVMDVLFQTVDTGIITFNDLATGLGKVLSSAAALEVPLEEIGAVVATMTLRGFTANQAMTSLGRIMQTFIRPSQRAKDVAGELGIELTAQKVASQGLIATMQEMFIAAGGNVTKFAEMFDRIQSTRGAISLFSDEGKLLAAVMEEMGLATAGAGAQAEAMEQRSKSLKFQLGVLRSQTLAVITDALTPLMAGLAGIVGTMNRVLAGKVPFFNFFADLESLVLALVVAFLFLKRQAIANIFLSLSQALLRTTDTMRLVAMESGVLAGAMAGLRGILKTIAPLLIFMAVFSLAKFAKQFDPIAKASQNAKERLADFNETLERQNELLEAGVITQEQFRLRVLEESFKTISDVIEKDFAPAMDLALLKGGSFGDKVLAIGGGIRRVFGGDFRDATEVVRDDLNKSLDEAIERLKETGATSDEVDKLARRLRVVSMTAKDPGIRDLFKDAAARVQGIADETSDIEDALKRDALAGKGLAQTFGDTLIVASDVREGIEKWLKPIKDAKALMEDILGLTSEEDIRLRAQIAPIETEIARRNAEIADLKLEQINRATELGIPLSEIDSSEDAILTKLLDQITALDDQNTKDEAIIGTLESRLEIEDRIDAQLQAQLDLLGLQAGKLPALLSLTNEEQRILSTIVGILQDGGVPALEDWIVKEKEAGRVLNDDVLAALLEVVGSLEDNKLELDVSEALNRLGLVEAEAERISGREFHIRLVEEFRRRRARGAQHGLRNFIGGLARVGERGEELVRLPRGADVIPRAGIGPALRQQARQAPSLAANAEVNITTSLLKDFLELKKAVLRAVSEQLDTAAARAGMAKPRFGTWGAGIPRT